LEQEITTSSVVLFDDVEYLGQRGDSGHPERPESGKSEAAPLIPVYPIYPSLPVQTILGQVKLYPPLSLGAVVSYAKKYRQGALCRKYRFLKKLFVDAQELELSYKEYGPGIFLFSNYIWSLSSNLAIARVIKRWNKRNITIFGGNSIPLKEKELISFLKSHPQVDICVRGEGEISLAELLDRLSRSDILADSTSIRPEALTDVSGLSYRCRQENGVKSLICTGERNRETDLSHFPSPYLNEDFDEEDVPKWIYATIETNRGCPYRCSFCNWGVGVGSKVYKFPMERVISEIDWLGRNQIPRLTVCDANFGIFDRDIEIAKAVAKAKRKYGYPRQFSVSYPKSEVKRLVEIAKILKDAGVVAFGTISLQSMDPTVLQCAHRRNVDTEALKKLGEDFRKEGLLMATDFMIGLPGATIQSVKNDLQFSFDHQLWAACYSTIALPNTSLTDDDYVKKFKIKVGPDGFVKSSFSFDEKELEKMKEVAVAYRLYVSYGLLKYILWFLQFDHHLKALDVIHDLTEFFKNPSATYQEISLMSRRFEESGGHPGSTQWPLPIGGDAFYDEIRAYVMDRYGVGRSSGLETAFAVQKAVMPQVKRRLPEKIKLRHDFSSYYFECLNADKTSNRRKLIEFPPGELEILDPHKICANLSRGEIKGASHIVYWELDTVMSLTRTMLFDVDPSGVN
jgi:radical SAM superfamily enzyme YgiQ (UPF0313 family)